MKNALSFRLKEEAKDLITDHPYLHTDGDYTSLAKNIRIILKRNFPGKKFHVRRYSFKEITIAWIDGPSSEQVQEVLTPFKILCFDEFEERWVVTPTAWTTAFGGIQKITCKRTFTKEKIDEAIEFIGEKYQTKDLPSHEDFIRGELKYYCPVDKNNPTWHKLIEEFLMK